MKLLATVFALSFLVPPACVSGQTASRGYEVTKLPTPVPVKNILYVRPFTVERPFLNTWSRGRAKLSTGVLVVLEVDPAYLDRRDAVVNPVLYAGNAAVIRLNRGDQSGRVIGIIPGSIDLTTAPIWFGAPELPARVTETTVQVERRRAEQAGLRPFAASRIARIQRPAVRVTDVGTLLRDVAAELVYEFSPQEKDLADTWRLPEATLRPNRQQ
ncbi:MAG TPA: hypothetical protein VNM92_05610 [Thermoanaerobaculia bacterium]|nr:hypothetical protein [Thermoanaerobaculia bacterium]